MASAGGVQVLDGMWFWRVYYLLDWVWLGTVEFLSQSSREEDDGLIQTKRKGQQVKPSQRSTSQLKLIQLSQLRESKITNTNERDEGLVNFLSKHA